MNAAEVRETLALRWPDAEYLSIPEAPEDSSRMGRKIDLLVISLWSSRGHERDAVEIKVSLSDWQRELNRGEKADFWWTHSHRFWVAVPAEIAEKVKPDLPPTWGLLSCKVGEAPKVAVKAARRSAEPLAWPTTIGIMRASANCGIGALSRAESRGRALGIEEGKRQVEKQTGDIYVRQELESLRARVKEFEEASGISIDRHWQVKELGQLVALLRREQLEPGYIVTQLGNQANALVQGAEGMLKAGRELQGKAKRISEVIEQARPTTLGEVA